MKWVYDDGGRKEYFDASRVGDCVTRAIAIASNTDYKATYDKIRDICGYSPRNGVNKSDTKKVVEAFGGVWHSCMSVGSGCKTHLKDGEVPMNGRIVCSLSKHLTAVIDGVIHDTFDPSRDGSRCVYGFWAF